MHLSLSSTLLLAGSALAWLPTEVLQRPRLHARHLPAASGKTLYSRDGVNLFARDNSQQQLTSGIRGVNLGSLFVFEPWIASDIWNDMCGSETQSEFDCGLKLGQEQTNSVFQNHWGTWYTQDDFDQMAQYGLNTVRIPVGYWMYPDIVDNSTEPFPQGGLEYLANICDMAANSGLFVIVDQHGAPGAQVASNADTGQNNPNPGFFGQSSLGDSNYERSTQFLGWMATQIHSDTRFRSVGMLEVINEPGQSYGGDGSSLITQFYPMAQSAVRAAEAAASVSAENQLTLFYMADAWGAGNPAQNLQTTDGTAYDDHRYVKWANDQEQTKQAYAQTSCNDDRGGAPGPTVMGEWSLSAPLDQSQQSSADWDPAQNVDWYAGWFAAQTASYEKQYGWIFWTWKTSALNDPRWDYQLAVQQGIIPQDLSTLDALAQSWCASNQ